MNNKSQPSHRVILRDQQLELQSYSTKQAVLPIEFTLTIKHPFTIIPFYSPHVPINSPQILPPPHTRQNLQWLINFPTCISLWCGKKLEHPTVTWRYASSTHTVPEVSIEPWQMERWGRDTTNCITELAGMLGSQWHRVCWSRLQWTLGLQLTMWIYRSHICTIPSCFIVGVVVVIPLYLHPERSQGQGHPYRQW